MHGRSDSAWRKLFAAGLLLRPIFIVPMGPSGPLGGWTVLPIVVASLFALHVLIAAAVFVGNRPIIAFGILTALVGCALAAIGAYLGLPMPWPMALVGYNVVLMVVGIKAWPEAGPLGHRE